MGPESASCCTSLEGVSVAGWSTGSPQWRRLRLVILERDGWRCRIRGEGCTLKATDADHIISRGDGGDPWDVTNLRAACAHCNRSRGGTAGAVKTNESRGYPPRLGW